MVNVIVADMNSLEQAARISMGGVQEVEPQPPPQPFLRPLRLGAVVLLAAVALLAAWQLT
ncbi:MULTISPECIES: hypothetical protein [unclassified Mesorhizobium]|uniref:hypothetical protein n=1 Tax=unclassified Mesorhizobium TaxID=325217 RepID=UPI000BAF9F37|nr:MULTISPECIES: hypothetical protein [unclassified Mesorhizobium]PBB88509.1 hypothetical protein CK216_01910 [Mesorhizobium sp. WSM3876]RWF24857.1 MAG: hypothetical protein EOS64_06215 [Mesorhizobium sp.]TGT29346.1 hypothetical protein EN817_06460 [Mesorhizobium sp. M3A.F.Ca.ET.174.01.1.1]TGT63672.1 hypothetical protein EN813_009870 [Mesorhizobium sp. M00.F.Ca.ET.170.01.1.1]